jgi:hypothetical protein
MTIDGYDPFTAPDAEEWLALDDDERMQLAVNYHVASRIELPNARVHATMHVVVENQVALGDETPVRDKLRQLMAQGLDRHDAVHAIASVLINHLARAVRGQAPKGGMNENYYAALKRLNAKKWRRSG